MGQRKYLGRQLRCHASEGELARCTTVKDFPHPRNNIGGFGVGFSPTRHPPTPYRTAGEERGDTTITKEENLPKRKHGGNRSARANRGREAEGSRAGGRGKRLGKADDRRLADKAEQAKQANARNGERVL